MPGALEALDDILAALDGGHAPGAGRASSALLGAQIALRNNRRLARRHALLAAARREDARRLRLLLSAVAQARAAREPPHARLPRAQGERRPPRAARRRQDATSRSVSPSPRRRAAGASTTARLADLITSLEEAQQAGRLAHRLKTLVFPSLLIVDEIGYLPISRTGAMLFFQLMSRRYEHASTVLTSNKGFEEWGEIFGDEVMAAALIDRLVHHCHIVNIRGNSYRMKHHADLAAALRHEPADRPPTTTRRSSRREATAR